MEIRNWNKQRYSPFSLPAERYLLNVRAVGNQGEGNGEKTNRRNVPAAAGTLVKIAHRVLRQSGAAGVVYLLQKCKRILQLHADPAAASGMRPAGNAALPG